MKNQYFECFLMADFFCFTLPACIDAVNEVEELYHYDPRNRLTEYTKGWMCTKYEYDNAGNLLADDRAQYAYDAFNRTERVETFDGHVQVNRYDAEGLRHELEEDGKLVQFIFRGDEIVAEKTDDNIIRLIRGYDLTASEADWARTYYHYASDEMRSTTQQYYLRARYYNPVIARFTQEDTYRGDGLNLYAYCRNNPVRYVDSSGHWCDQKEQVYQGLLKREGLTAETVDPDTQLRLMAEAANQVRGKIITLDSAPELPNLSEGGKTSNPSALKYNGDGTWTSNQGIIYGQGSKDGNRIRHVLQHTQPDSTKPVHTVFNVDKSEVIGLIDEAWVNKGSGVLQSNGNVLYDVNMGRVIGTNGEDTIRIVTKGYTNNIVIVTAFPKGVN